MDAFFASTDIAVGGWTCKASAGFSDDCAAFFAIVVCKAAAIFVYAIAADLFFRQDGIAAFFPTSRRTRLTPGFAATLATVSAVGTAHATLGGRVAIACFAIFAGAVDAAVISRIVDVAVAIIVDAIVAIAV